MTPLRGEVVLGEPLVAALAVEQHSKVVGLAALNLLLVVEGENEVLLHREGALEPGLAVLAGSRIDDLEAVPRAVGAGGHDLAGGVAEGQGRVGLEVGALLEVAGQQGLGGSQATGQETQQGKQNGQRTHGSTLLFAGMARRVRTIAGPGERFPGTTAVPAGAGARRRRRRR